MFLLKIIFIFLLLLIVGGELLCFCGLKRSPWLLMWWKVGIDLFSKGILPRLEKNKKKKMNSAHFRSDDEDVDFTSSCSSSHVAVYPGSSSCYHSQYGTNTYRSFRNLPRRPPHLWSLGLDLQTRTSFVSLVQLKLTFFRSRSGILNLLQISLFISRMFISAGWYSTSMPFSTNKNL